jgi:hypothetical protein
MLLFRDAKKIVDETTLGEVLANLIMPVLPSDVVLDGDTLEALATEVWQADANSHL